MARTTLHRAASIAVTLCLALTACGGSGDDSAESSSTDEAATATTATAEETSAGEAEEGTETDDAADADASGPVAVAEGVFPDIALEPTEPGPRPLLAWTAVEGAELYQLTILDADGEPYWSWSGTETEIHVGGVGNPDAMGARVFEPMTWMVIARGADGAPLAVSQRADLVP